MFRLCTLCILVLHKARLISGNDTDEEEGCDSADLPEGESCPDVTSKTDDGLSTGAIIGIVLACVGGVAIMAVTVLYFRKLWCFKRVETPPKRRKSTLPIIIFGNSNIGFTKPSDDANSDERVPIPYPTPQDDPNKQEQNNQGSRKQSTNSLSLTNQPILTRSRNSSVEPIQYSGSGYLVPVRNKSGGSQEQESRFDASTSYFNVIDNVPPSEKDNRNPSIKTAMNAIEEAEDDCTPPPLPVTSIPTIAASKRESYVRRQSDDSTYWDMYSVVGDGENVYADIQYSVH